SKDGKLTITTDKDKPAPKAEAALVEKKYKTLGKPDPMLNAMPDRALKDGEEVPELSEALAKTMKDQDDKTTVEGTKVTFKRKDGYNGIFDIASTVKRCNGPFKVSVPRKGTLAVRTVDACPASMDLTGPLTFELNDKDKK